MKKIFLLIFLSIALSNAQQYEIYDMNGRNHGSFNSTLDKSTLAKLAKEYRGSVLVKKRTIHSAKSIKNLNLAQILQIQKTLHFSQDSLGHDSWLEIEKNETAKICLDNRVLAWETSLNSSIVNDSCLAIQAPTLIGVDSLKVYFPDAEVSHKINLAIGMKYLNFENEEVLLGFNKYSKEWVKSSDDFKNEDPERLVKISGQYLVDKYPVTNCEFTQLMWDSIPATSSYQNKSIREDYYETWLSRKRAGVRYENCTTHDTAANMVTLFEAMEYANVRSIRDGLRPYYSLTPTDADKESILSKGQYIISYTDFTIHKKNFILVVTDNTSDGYRLPYYEEWMMLARGGDKKNTAPWGDSSGAFEKTLEYARFSTENYSYETEPVGQLKPNGYGLYDMFGLVQEHVLFKYALFDGNIGFSSCLKGGNYHVVLKESDFSLTEHPYWKWINYGYYEPGYPGYGAGFRLIRNIGNNAKWTEVKSDKE